MSDINNIYEERWLDLLKGQDPISPDARIGQGCKFGRGVIIEAGCQIGDGCMIGHYTVLRTGTVIGANSQICHHVVCEGQATIGERVTVHDQTHLTLGIVIEDDVFITACVRTCNTKRIVHGRDMDLVINAPTIQRGARIGIGAVILPGVIIGEEAYIGAGAVVTKHAKPYSVYYGNPAEFHGHVPKAEWLRPPSEDWGERWMAITQGAAS